MVIFVIVCKTFFLSHQMLNTKFVPGSRGTSNRGSTFIAVLGFAAASVLSLFPRQRWAPFPCLFSVLKPCSGICPEGSSHQSFVLLPLNDLFPTDSAAPSYVCNPSAIQLVLSTSSFCDPQGAPLPGLLCPTRGKMVPLNRAP